MSKELYKSILDETVQYYSEDIKRRAVSANRGCHYITPDGRMCAVGRCLSNPTEVQNSEISGEWAEKVLTEVGVLKPKYKQAKSLGFWRDLQNLHDKESNWQEGSLTEQGEFLRKRILNNIEEGIYNIE